MRYSLKLLLLFAIVLLTTTFCEKKLFAHVKVTGRVLNFFTRQPVSTDVWLVSMNKFSGSSDEDVLIGISSTDVNGYFTIGGRASRAEVYFLGISADSFDPRPLSIKVKDGKTTDLGTFLTFPQSFNYHITLIPDSGNCIIILNDTVPAGTHTALVGHMMRSAADTDFLLSYAKTNCLPSPNATKKLYDAILPFIFTRGDTINYTIHY